MQQTREIVPPDWSQMYTTERSGVASNSFLKAL